MGTYASSALASVNIELWGWGSGENAYLFSHGVDDFELQLIEIAGDNLYVKPFSY